MSAIRSYRDRVRDAGRTVSLRDASFGRANATAEQARELGIPAGTEVWQVHRLFTADGVPSAYMVEHIPLTVRGVPIDPSSMMQLEYGLFDMLDQHVPGAVSHTSTDIEAVTVDAADAQLLGIHAGVSVLRTEQLTTDRDGTVLAYGVTLQRTDVLRMRITR
ncbi:GntR family transcriptional regulator [Microbacterium sp. P06]|uniref:GntR family transcriptional regulator n=1 Tax=unclassified Microbacterium TaxID=2609290 RepID=UPI0037454BB7